MRLFRKRRADELNVGFGILRAPTFPVILLPLVLVGLLSACGSEPVPSLPHLPHRESILELINAERSAIGVQPLVLGTNVAAQLHADAALENCFSGYWGMDGLAPHMRYTLAGGYQSNAESTSGIHYCVDGTDGYRPVRDISEYLAGVVAASFDAPARTQLLDATHRKVNIGVAYDSYNVKVHLQFEGDYVSYTDLPRIEDSVLRLAGTTKNGIRFLAPDDLSVQLDYHEPPSPLAKGQLARVTCYSDGPVHASIMPPQFVGAYQSDAPYQIKDQRCATPYDFPHDAPAPVSVNDALRIQGESPQAPNKPFTQIVPWIRASEWTASGNQFAVRADIGPLLQEHGPGVYTIVVIHRPFVEERVISQYSVFHGITPPDTYSP